LNLHRYSRQSSRSEEAVEYDELSTFFRLNEFWDAQVDEDKPAPPVKPIGVPGASPAPSPFKHKPVGASTPSAPGAAPESDTAPAVSALAGLAGEAARKAAGSKATPAPAKDKTSVNKREDEHDVSDDLTEFGLQGVKVSDDDLLALVEELGLGGDEADELVKGLNGEGKAEKSQDGKAENTKAEKTKAE
jgi:hypothetical protein